MKKQARKLRSQKVGMAPGSLVHVGERRTARPDITLFEYDAGSLQGKALQVGRRIARARPRGRAPCGSTCTACTSRRSWRRSAGASSLHPLVLEDILNTDQRPKVDDYGDYLYIVARFFDYDTATGTVGSDQVSIVLGADLVLTFQERPTGTFDPLRERLRGDKGQIRKLGADYLAYSLLDTWSTATSPCWSS
jgi:magnesium transporter